MKKYFIAIDLGGTSAKCALVLLDGTIVKEFSVPTLVDNETVNSNRILKNLETHIDELLKTEKLSLQNDIKGIGLTVPGKYNFKKESVVLGPNINWKDYPVVAEARKIWPHQDIFCLNDADAAVMGQCYESGEENVVLYILGTGVGTSIVTNAELDMQKDGDSSYSMGEGGHRSNYYPENYGEIVCGCGLTGCLETVASARVINEEINICENLTEEENEEVNKFKKEKGLKKLNTIDLNEFIKDVAEDDLRFTIFKKMLDRPLTALKISMQDLYQRFPKYQKHHFYIAGGGAKIDKRFLNILQEKLQEDNLDTIQVDISKNPDKLALKGIIIYWIDKLQKKQSNTTCLLKNEQESELAQS